MQKRRAFASGTIFFPKKKVFQENKSIKTFFPDPTYVGAASVVFDGKLWLLGGKVAPPNVFTRTVEVLRPGEDAEWEVSKIFFYVHEAFF